MNRVKIIVLFFLFLMSVAAFSDVSKGLFKEANKYYEANKFNEAIEQYEKIIEHGYHSAYLFYNMANAYYRLDDFARAVKYFEKAYRLKPMDKDIRYNRTIVNDMVGNKDTFMYSIISFLSLNQVVIFVLFFYVCFFCTLFIPKIYKKRWIFWMRVFCFSMFLLFLLWFLILYNNNITKKVGVVLPQELNVYSGPSMDNTVAFTIVSGRKVCVLAELNDWLEIIECNKQVKGWVKKENIEGV